MPLVHVDPELCNVSCAGKTYSLYKTKRKNKKTGHRTKYYRWHKERVDTPLSVLPDGRLRKRRSDYGTKRGPRGSRISSEAEFSEAFNEPIIEVQAPPKRRKVRAKRYLPLESIGQRLARLQAEGGI